MALNKKIEDRYEGFKEGEKKEIDELILDDLEFRSLSDEEKKYLEEFTNLIILSANNCGIASLKNFPKLDNLEKLELTENRIPANELSSLVAYKQLRKLLLGNNKDIKKIDDLKPLTALKELYWLDLTGCTITTIKDYRNEVFKLFPTLEVLDRMDKVGKEVISDEEDDEPIDDDDDDSYSNDDDDDGEAPKGKRAKADSDDGSEEDSDEPPKKSAKVEKNAKKKKVEESDDSEDED